MPFALRIFERAITYPPLLTMDATQPPPPISQLFSHTQFTDSDGIFVPRPSSEGLARRGRHALNFRVTELAFPSSPPGGASIHRPPHSLTHLYDDASSPPRPPPVLFALSPIPPLLPAAFRLPHFPPLCRRAPLDIYEEGLLLAWCRGHRGGGGGGDGTAHTTQTTKSGEEAAEDG
ncbi:hypothetical protein niasHT_000097 [Heterodera trifolii]|uniref:Uncharacterized protein n=1 Tax=Heterodera trifolii TaxID=157864 RepID=A0ABD2M424_9BILA